MISRKSKLKKLIFAEKYLFEINCMFVAHFTNEISSLETHGSAVYACHVC